jgi:nucleoside-diphosphate-sugar epimerase
MAQEIIVVTGSTGKQVGAVARGLLKRGHKVRAITRDPNASQAKLLANEVLVEVRAAGIFHEPCQRTDCLILYFETLNQT